MWQVNSDIKFRTRDGKLVPFDTQEVMRSITSVMRQAKTPVNHDVVEEIGKFAFSLVEKNNDVIHAYDMAHAISSSLLNSHHIHEHQIYCMNYRFETGKVI